MTSSLSTVSSKFNFERDRVILVELRAGGSGVFERKLRLDLICEVVGVCALALCEIRDKSLLSISCACCSTISFWTFDVSGE